MNAMDCYGRKQTVKAAIFPLLPGMGIFSHENISLYPDRWFLTIVTWFNQGRNSSGSVSTPC